MGIVVLETDLELDGLSELAGLGLGALEDRVDGLTEGLARNFACHGDVKMTAEEGNEAHVG